MSQKPKVIVEGSDDNCGREGEKEEGVISVVDDLSFSCASEKTARIILLPDELLNNVFSYLEARDLVKASSVCQAWRSLAVSDEFWKYHFNKLAEKEQEDLPDGLRMQPSTGAGPIFAKPPNRNFRRAFLLHQKKAAKERRLQRVREQRTPGQKRLETFARYVSPFVYLICILLTTVLLSLYLDKHLPQTLWYQILTYFPVGGISMPLFFITGLIWLLKDSFVFKSRPTESFVPVSMAELDSSGTLTWFFLLWLNVTILLIGVKLLVPQVHEVIPWSVLFIPVQLAHVLCCLFFYWNFIYDDIEELRTMLELDSEYRVTLKDIKGFSAVAIAVSPFVLYLMAQLQLIALFLDNVIQLISLALLPTWLLLLFWVCVVPTGIMAYFWRDSKCMAVGGTALPCLGFLPAAFFITLAITVDGNLGLSYYIPFTLLGLSEIEFVLCYYAFVWLVVSD
eukprot:gb/GECH01013423.1/.p1 GENE.gb/GECH01013423.1/~~gb/GECH01013423.1/.p1  ORF type:complete len:452 (+),score=54.87 gb/GECH01013423.1/:1-1356(+)